ncbi:ribonuclease P protein component 1 [Candidatus Nitrosotalea okcheonensis]|uniref:Ribonuclease P protein component 1 n=1 Tax=Candidatus Nitrosotalea okcheonensis TaxID=1903276 RepID=A0A2H1FDP1_9ARCH|nr:ribonuclease P protein subunit [Candidatus Nitrosotalea okcheonensis]MDE1728061.1 ribonuclease P protein subunit [Nitrososphaerota archaeon]MDE1831619.1 ribonuclease P protein subunit [Nitrososphaerota archaeon]MDE1840272.1 ribonuclease P protein subunit [Nitrososphaerota archaeon]MDE1878320.1 ribonuclease P protein subunit [Nitrososphaerota archaeon]SMH70880.1 Ribonuclease P protein component 1 [Candidatus Nitrosotalea okcheonensis]
MITAENITRHELIGLETSIVKSNNSQIVGLHGKIIDETKSMFAIETATGVKTIPKQNSIWQFNLDEMSTFVDGNTIAKRSFERMGVKA